jgi:hypothetical protein
MYNQKTLSLMANEDTRKKKNAKGRKEKNLAKSEVVEREKGRARRYVPRSP